MASPAAVSWKATSAKSPGVTSPAAGPGGPLRIGVFTESWKPYVSGVVRSIDSFAAGLAGLGHELYIFAPSYPGHRRREQNVFRFLSLPAPTNPDFRLSIPLSLRLGATAGRLGLDLIHVHSPFLMGQLGARLARRLRLPLVFTFHTLYHHYAHYVPLPRLLTEWAALRWSRDFCNGCDLVIAPTSGVRDFLCQLGVTVPIEVLPTGVDPRRFRHGDPAWLRTTYRLGDGPVLLYVGRLGQEKNLSLLLRAYRRVRAARPDARLVLVGDGPQEPQLREEALRLGVAEGVAFVGRFGDRELAHAYAGADVFVFPSVTETQGIVLAEAQAAGLPVVAMRALGTADMVEDGRDGLLCDLSEESFAGAVLRLLADAGLRAAMARAARAKGEALTAPRMARRLSDLYHGLVRAGVRRRVWGRADVGAGGGLSS